MLMHLRISFKKTVARKMTTNHFVFLSQKIINVLVVGIACLFAFPPSQAQTIFEMNAASNKSLIVTEVYTFSYKPYSNSQAIRLSEYRQVPSENPEITLISYLAHLGKGETDVSLKFWDDQSQKLIKRKNANVSAEELSKGTRAMFGSASVRFQYRLDYGKYTILQVELLQPNQLKKDSLVEKYVLVKNGVEWKLTQDLADDPVYCCWDAPNGRINQTGVPGRGFPAVLKSLQ